MRLRSKLLLVSLLTLALPWAGREYVREMEAAQRSGVEDALLGSAAAVATVLRDRTDLLYRYPAAYSAGRDLDTDVYASSLRNRVELDGYANDWVPAVALADAPVRTAEDGLAARYAAGAQGRYLYLFVAVDRPRLTPGTARDRVLIAFTGPDGIRSEYRFATTAPGGLIARDRAGDPEPLILAAWEATGRGYHLELRVPLRLIGPRFGFIVLGAGGGAAGTATRADAKAEWAPGVLTLASDRLDETLVDFRRDGKRLRVTDLNGWQVGSAGDLADDVLTGGDPVQRTPLDRFYRWLLRTDDAAPVTSDASRPGLLSGPSVAEALSGRPGSGWHTAPGATRAVISAAQPIWHGDRVIGAVVLEQTSEAILTLTRHSFTRLMTLTLVATAVAAAGLLGFATALSFRIRRLRNAAERALGPEGSIASDMPGTGAGDELGDLARSFAMLLRRVGEYNEYLQALAARLSHELRTPLAVVQSSLENLDEQALSDEARVYAARAREGTGRLRAILTAMSEATRVEESIRGAESERFDLREVVAGNAAAYADVYTGRRVAATLPGEPCPMRGVPELIVQMLDKLIDNAVDFSPEGGTIEITLARETGGYVLAVANEGTPLPGKMRTQLFDSMVSMREKKGSAPHLGLGLFIVRLVAEAHGGRIEAANLPGGGGARFSVFLPAASSVTSG